jgi:hypothetical protein
MKTGIGHQSDHVNAPDGSIAIFCPACPQPGLNLPDDWKEKYSSYVYILKHVTSTTLTHCRNELIRTFIMDGNFSAEHMRYRTTEKDVALSPGMAFMANPELYKSHLRHGAEMTQVSVNGLIRYSIQYTLSPTHAIHTGP